MAQRTRILRHTLVIMGSLVVGAAVLTTSLEIALGAQGSGTSASASMVSREAVAPAEAPRSSAPVPPGYTGLNDPRLQECQRIRAVCDPATSAELDRQPFTKPPRRDGRDIGRAAAEAIARDGAPHVPADAPTFSAEMIGRAFQSAYGESRTATVDETRPVWIVTVMADVRPEALVPTTLKHSYSVVIDAQTGIGTDVCIGCAWLSASR